MIMDRTLSMSENQSVGTAAATVKSTRMIDFRLNGGEVLNEMHIVAMAVGAAPDKTVTTDLEDSADGVTFALVNGTSQTNVGNTLWKGRVPSGVRRFVRMSYTVSATLSKALVVKAGIILGEPETETFPKLQAFPPLEDIAKTTKVGTI